MKEFEEYFSFEAIVGDLIRWRLRGKDVGGVLPPRKDWQRAGLKGRKGLPAAVGSGAAILAGCSDLRPSAKTQGITLYAVGIPGIAVVTQSEQIADNTGDDENAPTQSNPTTVNTKLK